jgi:hydrogenase nickel incorporation protein HypA/HybF
VHEAKLCLSLIDLAKRALEEAGGRRILALRVSVGTLSGVQAEALAAAFPICAAETAAEGASLELEVTSGRQLLLRDMEIV